MNNHTSTQQIIDECNETKRNEVKEEKKTEFFWAKDDKAISIAYELFNNGSYRILKFKRIKKINKEENLNDLHSISTS